MAVTPSNQSSAATPLARPRRRVVSPPQHLSARTVETSFQSPARTVSSLFAPRPAADRLPSVDVSPPSGERRSPVRADRGRLDEVDDRAVQRLYGLSDLTMTESMAARAASVSGSNGPMGMEGSGKMIDAVVSRLLSLEDSVAAQMNRHVRDRGQLTMDVERAKYDTENMEFLMMELQTSAEVLQRSLKERVLSRVATLRQLRDDAAAQSKALMEAELRSLPAQHRSELGDGALLSRMSVLRTMLSQFETHQQVQFTALEHRAQQSLGAIRERLAAVHHVISSGLCGAGSGSPQRQDGVTAMLDMITRFATETREQLAALRQERLAFEDHFVDRISRVYS
jgi:hypothetical protein